MLKQSLQQKLLQKLSPQQIQFIKLLQVPTSLLETRIKEELEINPALEDGNFSTEKEQREEEREREDGTGESEDINVDDYIQEQSISEYSKYSQGGDDENEGKEMPIAITPSFHEGLTLQLGMQDFTDEQVVIAEQVIGSIDDDGYLRREISSMVDDLAFTRNFQTTEEDVEGVLRVIQTFEPAGVGARSLQECLKIQLIKRDEKIPSVALAIKILDNHIDSFTKKHYTAMAKSLGIDMEQLKPGIDEILRLNPRPGGALASSAMLKNQQIIPDFILRNKDGDLQLSLNSKNAPELRVSRGYKEMLQTYSESSKTNKNMKEAVQFVKQKLDSAKWFIDAIRQRQATLMNTMNAILELQYEYFIDGDETKLRPMILKDVAEKIEMDISTVSRVANSKYVQTDFGIFLLKSFFSEGIQMESGEEVSNKEVKRILSDCIQSEEKRKPLADEKLAKVLKDKGYNIARRTVAKYREQMGVPVARLRKEL
ncbi:MAG: RNA polymerase sigma-54 factor [Sphingobacteriales bacterium]|jgi:RNA polymerase sigma-54 factor